REARAVDEDPPGDALAVAVVVSRGSGVLAEVRRLDAVGTTTVRTEVRAGARRVAERPLSPGPAVVLTLGDEVHLLVADLAHVTDPEASGLRVEPEAERVAESPRPDLGPRRAGHIARVRRAAGAAGAGRHLRPRRRERIVGRDAAVEVDAQHLAVGGGEAGPDVVGDGSPGRKAGVGPGVTDADVELPVRADGQSATVVVRGSLEVLEQDQDASLRRTAVLTGAGQKVVRAEDDAEHAVLVGRARPI